MTPEVFRSDLEGAKPGEWILYAAGATREGKRAALASYFRGQVELLQRRVSGPFANGAPGAFSYYAVKRRNVWPPYVRAGLERLVGSLYAEPVT